MNREDLILSLNRIPPIDEFLDSLGIKPQGLGSQLFSGVYYHFFVASVDLRDEYEKYYCVEYSGFSEYLELAHEIYLRPEELEKKHIIKIKSPSGVVDEAYDNNAMDAVINCIRKLEAINED